MRSFVPIACLTSLVAVFAGLVWLTRNPEAEILRQAQKWALVGPLAREFRALYLPAPRQIDRRTVDTELLPPVEIRAGREERSFAVGDLVWVLPETRMYRAPATDTAEVVRFDSITNVVKLERRGDWFLVDWQGIQGWVFLKGYVEEGGPPFGFATLPPGPLESVPAGEKELARARKLLFGREMVLSLGPYTLYTNYTDPDFLHLLGRIAERVEGQYETRTGCNPLGSARESIVLYRSEASYRLLQAQSPPLLGLHSSGHNSGGLVVFFVGERSRHEVTSTLVHELAHLLNRRALGPALPPFLDEGIADDLAMAKWTADGSMSADAFSGEILRRGGTLSVAGGLSTLWFLRDLGQRGELPSLAEVVGFDWNEFVRSDQISVNYGLSALWIRQLLAQPASASVFRSFLRDVAAGAPADGERLRLALGSSWPALDTELRRAIVGWAQDAGLPSSSGITIQ